MLLLLLLPRHMLQSTAVAPPLGRGMGTPHTSQRTAAAALTVLMGQGLGVEGNQLEYLEESFQLIALMVRGNAARIKDDMK